MAIEAPEFVVQEIENTVCPKIGLDCSLVPVSHDAPLHESPLVLETVHEETPLLVQLTNVGSPLRTSVGTTCQLVMFGDGGVGVHAFSAHPYEHGVQDSVKLHCGALPYVRWQSLSAFAPVSQ